jgi:DNA-binding NarL/FixJ family response regulator
VTTKTSSLVDSNLYSSLNRILKSLLPLMAHRSVDIASEKQPDLVLMDLKMPIMNGVKATEIIKQRFPEVKVLILTTYGDDDWLFDAIRSGADGFLLKDIPHDELFSAIRGTVEGNTHIDPKVARKLFDHAAQRTPVPKYPIAIDHPE